MSKEQDFGPVPLYGNSIRSDLPVVVVSKAGKRSIAEIARPGQLFCVGRLYFRTRKGLVRVKVA
jgi:hypothetical protein